MYIVKVSNVKRKQVFETMLEALIFVARRLEENADANLTIEIEYIDPIPF